MQYRKFIFAPVAAIALAAGILGATPALASTCTSNCTGNGSVAASITIPVAFTFSVTTSSITFTGSPGGVSNVPTVSYTVTDNDPAGNSVSVAASGNLISGANNIPIGDISVWGPAQAYTGTPQAAPVGLHYPQALSTTALVTESKATTDVGTTYMDSYSFLGVNTNGGSCFLRDALADCLTSAFIPGGAIPGTYSATFNYLALAN